MRRLAVANFPDSSILDLPERGAGAREPGHQRTCRNVESANMDIIDDWTLPWPAIKVPTYQIRRVGAWELSRISR